MYTSISETLTCKFDCILELTFVCTLTFTEPLTAPYNTNLIVPYCPVDNVHSCLTISNHNWIYGHPLVYQIVHIQLHSQLHFWLKFLLHLECTTRGRLATLIQGLARPVFKFRCRDHLYPSLNMDTDTETMKSQHRDRDFESSSLSVKTETRNIGLKTDIKNKNE